MTKILILSDIHSRFSVFTPEKMKIAEQEPNMILIAGDITNHGALESDMILEKTRFWLYNLQKAGNCPVFFITGNHDKKMHNVDFALEGVANITDKAIVCQNLKIIGLNLSPCYDLPNLSYTWERMTAIRQEEIDYFTHIDQYYDIVLSHCPPYKHLDLTASGQHIGSLELVKQAIKHKPKAIVCGHVHNWAGVNTQLNETVVYNTATSFRYINV